MKSCSRILFVDDDAAILENFRMVLHGKYDVHTAEGPQEALKLLDTLTFPVMVSDLKMAKMDGIELLQVVKQKHPATIRILLTGHADLESAISAVNKGEVFRFLQKPCPPDLLTRVLKDGLRQYQLVMAERHLWETHQKLADAYLDLGLLSEQQARLIATASHDLRSPLTSIVGFVKLIAKDVGSIGACGEKKLKRINDKLSVISDESERMLRLINELLDNTKPGGLGEEWADEEVDVRDVIDKAHQSILGRLEEKPGVEVLFDRPDRCPTITASFDKLMQVFVNLLDNAVKFTPEGTVRVRLETEGRDALRISVEDDGCGIEPDRLPLIFESYHSTDNSNAISGLGLPICKQIIEHYKGTIEAVSEPGAGTTFTVRLPV
jgi:signal transduction histidine kinase